MKTIETSTRPPFKKKHRGARHLRFGSPGARAVCPGARYPRCSMVLEYLPTFAQTKSPSYVGKYTSTMEHMGTYKVTIIIIGIIIPLTIWLGYL